MAHNLHESHLLMLFAVDHNRREAILESLLADLLLCYEIVSVELQVFELCAVR